MHFLNINPLFIVGNYCFLDVIATMSTNPSAIMLIVRTFEAESKRISKLDVGELREYIGDISPSDLATLWKLAEGMLNDLDRRLFEDIDLHIVSEAMSLLPLDSQVVSLKYMRNEQRRHIVDTWSLQRKTDVLTWLEGWQDNEDEEWTDRIADVRVMTGRPLPEHYPPGMSACAFCGNQHSVWDSIIVLDCRTHSYCERCDTEEGHCSECDIQSVAASLERGVL